MRARWGCFFIGYAKGASGPLGFVPVSGVDRSIQPLSGLKQLLADERRDGLAGERNI